MLDQFSHSPAFIPSFFAGSGTACRPRRSSSCASPASCRCGDLVNGSPVHSNGQPCRTRGRIAAPCEPFPAGSLVHEHAGDTRPTGGDTPLRIFLKIYPAQCPPTPHVRRPTRHGQSPDRTAPDMRRDLRALHRLPAGNVGAGSSAFRVEIKEFSTRLWASDADLHETSRGMWKHPSGTGTRPHTHKTGQFHSLSTGRNRGVDEGMPT